MGIKKKKPNLHHIARAWVVPHPRLKRDTSQKMQSFNIYNTIGNTRLPGR